MMFRIDSERAEVVAMIPKGQGVPANDQGVNGIKNKLPTMIEVPWLRKYIVKRKISVIVLVQSDMAWQNPRGTSLRAWSRVNVGIY